MRKLFAVVVVLFLLAPLAEAGFIRDLFHRIVHPRDVRQNARPQASPSPQAQPLPKGPPAVSPPSCPGGVCPVPQTNKK